MSGTAPAPPAAAMVDGPKPPLAYRLQAKTIVTALKEGNVVLFLGAGAAVDFQQELRLPTGSELAKKLADAAELDWHQSLPLSTAAFYYESLDTRYGLNRFLNQEIGNDRIPASQTIEAVVELVEVLEKLGKGVLVVTTNYDQTFERAYEARRKERPAVLIYRGGTNPSQRDADLHIGGPKNEPDFDPETWHPPAGHTCLYKIHGCISDSDTEQPTLVVTEEDYVNFLTNTFSVFPKKRLLKELSGRMSLHVTLFIGYSLSDWNFRVIFKGTAEEAKQKPSFAVQYFDPNTNPPPSATEVQRWNSAVGFWKQKDVHVINWDAKDFVKYLIERLKTAAAP